jgi:hypothetical protein
MSAACVRAEMLRSDDAERGADALRLADAFCRQARVRTDTLFDRLWTNSDHTDRELADAVRAGKYRWLEDGVLDPSLPGPWIAATDARASRAPNVHRSTRASAQSARAS